MKQIDKDTISLEWCTDDVLSECDWLTKEQAREVLSTCLHKHDGNIGMWEVINFWACEMFPNEPCEEEKINDR